MIREKLYELLVNCIPGDLIVKILMEELLSMVENTDASLKPKIIEWVSFYENKMQKGSKPIFHIEAMLARIMVLYKNAMEDFWLKYSNIYARKNYFI